MRKAWHKGTGELIPKIDDPFMWHHDDDIEDDWRQLEFRRKAFEAGHLGAALDALLTCLVQGWPLPLWLTAPVVTAFRTWLLKTPGGSKWRGEHHRDQVDYERVKALQEARRRGYKWSLSTELERMGELDAYEYAARLLPKRITGAAVKKSYQRFKKNWRKHPSDTTCSRTREPWTL